MRKLSLVLVASCLALPFSAEAKTLDELLAEKGVVAAGGSAEAGKVYYNKGTRLEFGDDFSLKMNMVVQSRYEYTQNDGSDDTSEFRMRRVRLDFSGHLLNKQFSYKVQNDFVGAGDSGSTTGRRTEDLKDAWIQWNMDEAMMVRMGQFKTDFGMQFNNSSTKLQFVERSDVTNHFVFDRNIGAMLHGEMDGLGYSLGIFNGDSDGEGANRRGTDNNHNGIAHVHYNVDGYDRGYEGDIYHTDGMAATFGGSVAYGQGATMAEGDFDRIALQGDAGIRSAGFSASGEVFWNNQDFDLIPGDAGELKEIGYYVQGGFAFVPEEWDAALRYGMIDHDDESAEDTSREYSAVVNYYINGHELKLQNQITFRQMEYRDGTPDTDDVVYTMNLAGNF